MMAKKKSPHPIDKYVGARIRMRRLKLDMSQTQLGEGLGLTFQQVQKYEKGSNRVSASRLQQIVSILQVPVAFFFEGAPSTPTDHTFLSKAPSPAFVAEFLASTDGLTLVRAFTQIKSSRLRRQIVNLVEQISE